MALKWQLALALVAATMLGHSAAQEPLDWWQTTVFYQIYPRSFQDSTGNGIGDLAGITSRLQYFKDMGVEAIWMSPIFKSPMVDFGYDISDFFDIDPLFGTLEDFDALMAKAKELGIHIILDFVANHSSDQHDWFVRSVANESMYSDFYVWVDPKGIDPDGNPIPPNNWVSVFKGPAWTYREERGQFYLHQFDPKQPDLNYRNPMLAAEMEKVLIFWMDRGVHGFRVDAIPHQYEIESLDDEPETGFCASDEYCFLDHIYTKNLPETYAIVKRWRKLIDEYSYNTDNITRILMTEAYADINQTMDYYGTPDEPGAHFTFNFELLNRLNNVSKSQDFVEAVNFWMDNMRYNYTSNWVIGNHDQKRASNRYGRGLEDAMNMVVQMLPGVAVTYYGEEIGMQNTFISWEDTVDPPGCNAGPDRYEEFSRDPSRTPFQWDDSAFAGFSPAGTDSTWLPVNPNYLELNLAAQQAAAKSHYKTYTALVALRKTETIQRGGFSINAINDNVFTIVRTLADRDTYIVVVNLGQSDETVDLTSIVNGGTTIAAAGVNSNYDVGQAVAPGAILMHARDGIVILDQVPSGGKGTAANKGTISISLLLLTLFVTKRLW